MMLQAVSDRYDTQGITAVLTFGTAMLAYIIPSQYSFNRRMSVVGTMSKR